MDNKNRNVHNSGPLGVLIGNGQVKKIEDIPQIDEGELSSSYMMSKKASLYFKTQSGIKFSENELYFVDPNECQPWKYANRQANELGNMQELIQSIKEQKQLQPAVVRKHLSPPNKEIKYEIIFGCRRHIACLELNIPFLIICKDVSDIEAVSIQDAENKIRNNVSNYSNAKLYQNLLKDKIFKTEKELSEKLSFSSSSFNDLMSYAKIPDDIVTLIPSIHTLSKNMALKIVQLINKSDKNHEKILKIAPRIGKDILSPAKLEVSLENLTKGCNKFNKTKQYLSKSGKKLFTSMIDHRGSPRIVINKNMASKVNLEDLNNYIIAYFEKNIESGAPDSIRI